ncbi:helix-turn-helix domain-containing protein [Saccharibacillus brassicae]|nr:helix-turn-helix transcriptional regulator [Saccharibacillus brassicae]
MDHPGIRIRELRMRRGLSQDQLAAALDMNRVNISNYERGKITNIPGDVLLKLANKLNTSTDYLLGREEHVEIETIAAHHDGEDFTEEEQKEIEAFKAFVKSKRNREE